METYRVTVSVTDDTGDAQASRFETLPERIPFEAMIAEHRVSSRNPAGDEYYAERTWRQAACFALDGI
jgi:hypothetical protein